MIREKRDFVNHRLFGLAFILAIVIGFNVFSKDVAEVVILTVAPFPKEALPAQIAAKKNNPSQATTGNIFIHNGSYYIGRAKTAVNISGDSEVIKLVITDRLKPRVFKDRTNKGLELDLTPELKTSAPESSEVVNDTNTLPPSLQAKCFLLTKKYDPGVTRAWDIKIIEVLQGQPLPPEFVSNFTVQQGEKSSGNQNPLLQNDVIFFVENPIYADMDVSKPLPVKEQEQAVGEEAVLPTLFVRTDIVRYSAAKILINLPFLTRVYEARKVLPDKRVEMSIRKEDGPPPIEVAKPAEPASPA